MGFLNPQLLVQLSLRLRLVLSLVEPNSIVLRPCFVSFSTPILSFILSPVTACLSRSFGTSLQFLKWVPFVPYLISSSSGLHFLAVFSQDWIPTLELLIPLPCCLCCQMPVRSSACPPFSVPPCPLDLAAWSSLMTE